MASMQAMSKARFNSDNWRWGIVALVVAGAAVGTWFNAREHPPIDGCWFPGLPRYPNATLTSVRHDEDSWYAMLDTRDDVPQVEAYYREKVPLLAMSNPSQSSALTSWMTTGQYPNSSLLMVSIRKPEPSGSRWNPIDYLDTRTHIMISVQAPKPPPRAGWPFDREHPTHFEWSAAVGKAIGKALVPREKSKP